jgi:hypothetical protein
MMNGAMGEWYSGMGSGNWTFEILILVLVIAALAAVIATRKSK